MLTAERYDIGSAVCNSTEVVKKRTKKRRGKEKTERGKRKGRKKKPPAKWLGITKEIIDSSYKCAKRY